MPALILVFTCALWGLSFPVIKALSLEQTARMPEASSGFLAAWLQVARFGLGALLLAPMVARMPRPTRGELRQGLQLALWGGLGMGIQADGLAYTEASTSAFLTQAYCVLLPLWAAVQTRRRPSLRIVGATMLVLIGGAILSGVRPDSLKVGRGETETLVAAMFFGLQILTLENPRYAVNRGRPVTLIMCAGIALLYIPVTLITSPAPGALITAGASWPTFVLVASLVVFCTVGAFLLMNTWQRRVSATEAGLIYTTEPIFAAAYALFLPAGISQMANVPYANEQLTTQLIAGGSLILSANAWMQWKSKPHPPGIAPVP